MRLHARWLTVIAAAVAIGVGDIGMPTWLIAVPVQALTCRDVPIVPMAFPSMECARMDGG